MSEGPPATTVALHEAVAGVAGGPVVLITDSDCLARSVAGPGVIVRDPARADSHPDELPRAALAIVDGAAGFSGESAAIQLVSRLRDCQAERVVVIAGPGGGGPLGRQALIGLGFRRWASSHDERGQRRWYAFDLADYKVTPDWLNARHWANPELWDKYRW